ncbi:PHD finger protein 14-like [Saccoglossus kowalevskii]
MEDDDDGVGFLYKTMLSRDPKKRRIKPVEKHLIQVTFGDDSEDDSDFEIEGHDDDDEMMSDISEDESADDNKDEDSDDASESDDDDDDEDEDEDEDDKDSLTIGELVEKAASKQQAIKSSSSDDKPYAKMKVLICCVCLGDNSNEEDEIIECDYCGIPVHEGCYGASDVDSAISNQTSSSTEPWFCDSCKAGVKSPVCELCPNMGGIFKQTDTGRWVHVVCSLYIPGVTFGDVDKLSPVVLSELGFNKWATRDCCYCEDDRFARTGIVIGCDAGMCRNYFHVTCAQRVGLLSEASPEEDIADPFYAYCKVHVEKLLMKSKRQNWLAVKSHCRQQSIDNVQDEILKNRILAKLELSKEKYNEGRKKIPPPWVPTDKVPRLLSSCPSACRRLMKKAEMLGISTDTVSMRSANESHDHRGKWRVAPAFSPEFVAYFLGKCSLSADIETLKVTNNDLRGNGESLWSTLSKLGGKKLPLPSVLRSPHNPKVSPTMKETSKSSTMTVINLCGICSKSTDQHLLALCDTCSKFYHLGCLDPPLTRMPKKTTYSGWQCSECCSSGSDSSVAPVEVTAEPTPDSTTSDKTRRSRRQIKEPNKFTPVQALYADSKKIAKIKHKKFRKDYEPVKRKLSTTLSDGDSIELPSSPPPPPAKREKRKSASRKSKEIDVRTKCSQCGESGDNSTLVRYVWHKPLM